MPTQQIAWFYKDNTSITIHLSSNMDPNSVEPMEPMGQPFTFIMEAPHLAPTGQKRLRVVTSCDTCRQKKIGCKKQEGHPCEPCQSSKIKCLFRDQEKYYLSKASTMAGPNANVYAQQPRPPKAKPRLDAFSVASGSVSPSATPTTSRPKTRAKSRSPHPTAAPDNAAFNRYAPYPTPDSRHVVGQSHTRRNSSISSFDAVKHNNSFSYNYTPETPQISPQYSSNSRPNSYQSDGRSPVLFDPDNHHSPESTLMKDLIQIFFEIYSHEFPFLFYEDVFRDFWSRHLNNILANCIAAFAVKHSSRNPQIRMPARDLPNIAENYIDVAKTLLNNLSYMPTLDTLQAIMLLCWFEHHHHRLPGFRTYYGMANKMASELGLQDTSYDPMSEFERSRRRAVWAGMVQLHMTANSF